MITCFPTPPAPVLVEVIACRHCGAAIFDPLPFVDDCSACDWHRAIAAARQAKRGPFASYARAHGAVVAAQRAEERARDAYVEAARERMAARLEWDRHPDSAAMAAWSRRACELAARLGELYTGAIGRTLRAQDRLARVNFANNRRLDAAREGRVYRGV